MNEDKTLNSYTMEEEKDESDGQSERAAGGFPGRHSYK